MRKIPALNAHCLITSAALFAIVSLVTDSTAQIFEATFDGDFGFNAPPGHFNGAQFDTGHPVAFSGSIPDWQGTGGGVVHAVDHANILTFTPPSDPAVMIWQDNVITLDAPIAGSNNSGQNYTIDFLASPAVYQAGVQQTTAADGLLIEVLRDNDSVLDSFTHLPGAWAGDIILNPASFQYIGDGSGDVRLRIGPSNPGSLTFGGAIDDVTLTGTSEIFADGFEGFTAPPQNFNGQQFESGLDVAFGGDVAGWSKQGGGAVHAVFAEPGNIEVTTNPQDFAVMFWQDNVIEQFSFVPPIAGSNTAGQQYKVDFEASPAVYQAPGEQTGPEDGLVIELIRGEGESIEVVASHEHLPGAWQGEFNLVPGSFVYTGDGSGDVRFRIRTLNPTSGHFGGAIDSLSLSLFTGSPGDFNADGAVDAADYTVWRDHLGAADESAISGGGDGLNGVDQTDYHLWVSHFGSSGSGSLAAASIVPEPAPATLMLIGSFAFGLLASVRRRRKQ
ncbi:MAG: hypothetical protein WD851_12295 [Pirellulales bacterium]